MQEQIDSKNDFKGQLYSDFNIFTGQGISPIEQNDNAAFPFVELLESNDSLLVNYWFDDLNEGEGTLKFKKELNYFYRIDTLEFDGQKSIWYEYHTENYVLQFEKYFINKNQSTYKLKASLLTLDKFEEFDLPVEDSVNIGVNSNFLVKKSTKTEYNIYDIDIDEINPRARLNKFSMFWHHFLCSGKYWTGYGVSCEYLN